MQTKQEMNIFAMDGNPILPGSNVCSCFVLSGVVVLFCISSNVFMLPFDFLSVNQYCHLPLSCECPHVRGVVLVTDDCSDCHCKAKWEETVQLSSHVDTVPSTLPTMHIFQCLWHTFLWLISNKLEYTVQNCRILWQCHVFLMCNTMFEHSGGQWYS